MGFSRPEPRARGGCASCRPLPPLPSHAPYLSMPPHSAVDKKHGPTWHVVVGRNFGSYVTHEVRVPSALSLPLRTPAPGAPMHAIY